MLKDTHTQTPQTTGEQGAERSPLNIVKQVDHPAHHDGKLRGAGAITPPSSGVTTASPGAVITKP
jgi:hypothetical protein